MFTVNVNAMLVLSWMLENLKMSETLGKTLVIRKNLTVFWGVFLICLKHQMISQLTANYFAVHFKWFFLNFDFHVM